jgi:RND family efflux transporter MFP subunit
MIISRLKSFRLPSVILIVTAIVVFGLISTRPRMVPVQAPERIWHVDTVTAKHATVQPTLKSFGEIVAGRSSELRPLVSGLMIEIGPNFVEGGMVKKGELLVQIDPFSFEADLAEQRSMLKESRVRLEVLKHEMERAKELLVAKTVSEQFFESAELDFRQQEAVVEQREIGVQRAERDLRDTRLIAPFDGAVSDVNAALGKQFSGFGSDMIAELIDTSRAEVKFSLTNSQYGRLIESNESLVGQPLKVFWNVGTRRLEFDARIDRVGAKIISTTGGVDIYAVIQTGGKQTRLRPGAFVSISTADKTFDNVVRAPESALNGEDSIFVITDGRLDVRKIQIVGYAGTDLLFRSAGEPAIQDGEQIVTTQIREGGVGAKVMVR